MTMQLIDLGQAGASLEFEASELPAVRDAIDQLFGPISEAPGIDMLAWTIGDDQLFLSSEWDGVALLAATATAVAKLRHLESVMRPDARRLMAR